MVERVKVSGCDECPLCFDDVVCGHPDVGANMRVKWPDDPEQKVGGSGLPQQCPLRRERSLTIELDEKVWYAECRDFTRYDLNTMPGSVWNIMSVKEREKWTKHWAGKGVVAFGCVACGYPVSFPGGPCDACSQRAK